MKRLLILCLFVLLPQTLWANPYAKQFDSPRTIAADQALRERISKFEGRKRYTIKNLPAFHKQTRVDDKAKNLCQNCHGRLPHANNEATRAFLNQHSQRIDCLTCHYRPKDEQLDYQWFVQADFKTIAPFYAGDALVIAAEDKFSEKIKTQWDNADIYQKERLHQKLHQPLNFGKEKIECSECHQKDGLLDLQKLGFEAEKIETIENNLISRFLQGLKTENKKQQDNPRILLRGLLQ